MNSEPLKESAVGVELPVKTEKAERGRSRIEWPYYSLDEAFKLAKGVFELGGSCQIEQLAGELKQSAAGGGFRLKVQAARVFGLLSLVQGNITLTPLGTQIVEAEEERAARVTAFLNVPLYKAVYEMFKGKTLPGPSGLEGAFVTLGVAAKQKEKARQAFQRSAKEAGFFAYGSTKLVSPVLGQEKPAKEKTGIDEQGPTKQIPSPPSGSTGGTGGNGIEAGGLHPFIQGLLRTLPAPESPWPLDARRKWLQSALSIFDVIYEGGDDSHAIAITVNRSSSN